MDLLKLEMVKLESISPHPKNSREHSQDNLEAIKRSLQKFGQVTPLVVGRMNFILKGCGTWQAMREINMQDVKILRVKLTPEQELAYALADNKTGDLSEFNFQGVADILKELQAGGFDLEATGFASFEIEPLLEAEWNAGKPGTMPNISDAKKTHLEFGPREMEKIMLAIRSLRQRNLVIANSNIAEQVALVCSEYLREHPIKAVRKL
jgi:hypothetical protein